MNISREKKFELVGKCIKCVHNPNFTFQLHRYLKGSVRVNEKPFEFTGIWGLLPSRHSCAKRHVESFQLPTFL